MARSEYFSTSSPNGNVRACTMIHSASSWPVLPDWTVVTAQIWSGERQVCEVRTSEGRLAIAIFPNPDEPTWNLAHAEFVEALSKAKQMID